LTKTAIKRLKLNPGGMRGWSIHSLSERKEEEGLDFDLLGKEDREGGKGVVC